MISRLEDTRYRYAQGPPSAEINEAPVRRTRVDLINNALPPNDYKNALGGVKLNTRKTPEVQVHGIVIPEPYISSKFSASSQDDDNTETQNQGRYKGEATKLSGFHDASWPDADVLHPNNNAPPRVHIDPINDRTSSEGRFNQMEDANDHHRSNKMPRPMVKSYGSTSMKREHTNALQRPEGFSNGMVEYDDLEIGDSDREGTIDEAQFSVISTGTLGGPSGTGSSGMGTALNEVRGEADEQEEGINQNQLDIRGRTASSPPRRLRPSTWINLRSSQTKLNGTKELTGTPFLNEEDSRPRTNNERDSIDADYLEDAFHEKDSTPPTGSLTAGLMGHSGMSSSALVSPFQRRLAHMGKFGSQRTTSLHTGLLDQRGTTPAQRNLRATSVDAQKREERERWKVPTTSVPLSSSNLKQLDKGPRNADVDGNDRISNVRLASLSKSILGLGRGGEVNPVLDNYLKSHGGTPDDFNTLVDCIAGAANGTQESLTQPSPNHYTSEDESKPFHHDQISNERRDNQTHHDLSPDLSPNVMNLADSCNRPLSKASDRTTTGDDSFLLHSLQQILTRLNRLEDCSRSRTSADSRPFGNTSGNNKQELILGGLKQYLLSGGLGAGSVVTSRDGEVQSYREGGSSSAISPGLAQKGVFIQRNPGQIGLVRRSKPRGRRKFATGHPSTASLTGGSPSRTKNLNPNPGSEANRSKARPDCSSPSTSKSSTPGEFILSEKDLTNIVRRVINHTRRNSANANDTAKSVELTNLTEKMSELTAELNRLREMNSELQTRYDQLHSIHQQTEQECDSLRTKLEESQTFHQYQVTQIRPSSPTRAPVQPTIPANTPRSRARSPAAIIPMKSTEQSNAPSSVGIYHQPYEPTPPPRPHRHHRHHRHQGRSRSPSQTSVIGYSFQPPAQPPGFPHPPNRPVQPTPQAVRTSPTPSQISSHHPSGIHVSQPKTLFNHSPTIKGSENNIQLPCQMSRPQPQVQQGYRYLGPSTLTYTQGPSTVSYQPATVHHSTQVHLPSPPSQPSPLHP